MSKRKGHKRPDLADKVASEPSDIATPRAILDAIFPTPGACGSTRLQPMRIVHFLALEMIGSPLIETSESQRDTTTMDVVSSLAILSTPPDLLFDLLTAGGRPALDRLAADFAVHAPIADIRNAAERVVAHCRKAFATLLPGSGGGGADGPLAPPPAARSTSTVPPPAAPGSAS